MSEAGRRQVEAREREALYEGAGRRLPAGPVAALADTKSLSEGIYQHLTDKIIGGEIGYGEKLSIRKVARAFNVSTMPVREAIRRLEMEDVVAIKPRSNCVVKVPTRSSMLAAFEMRELLEVHAAEKIYPTVTPEELLDMKDYLQQMDRFLPAGNADTRMREYARYDQLFHQEICVLARNPYLLRMYRMNMLHLNIALTFQAGVEPDMVQVSQDHRSIFRSLMENSPRAVDALKRHLRQCRRNMVQGELFRSLPESAAQG